MDHVQDFKKGVVQDFYDQPEGTLYDLQNFQLINTGGSSFAITSPEGNIPLLNITAGYTPIGISGNQGRLILHSAWTGNTLRHNGEIGIVDIDKQTLSAIYTPIYNHVGLNYLTSHAIESLLFPENSRTEGNYWTDNNNPPRTINTRNPIFNTLLNTTTLVPGNQYMVVQGQVDYGGVLYGPGEAAGTVFIDSGLVLTDTTAAPLTLRLIAYYPLELLDWTPKFRAGCIRLKRPIPGNAPCGVYTFVYQLLDDDGAATNWSMPTLPIRVAGPGSVGSVADYSKHQGHPFQTPSSQGIELEITNIDTNFTRIRVAFVFGTELHVYEEPIAFIDMSLDSSSFIVDHPDDGFKLIVQFTGTEYLIQLTEEDIIQVLLRIEKVKTIATVNNILFPGNISYFKDVAWNPGSLTTVKFTTKSLTHDVMGYGNTEGFVGHAAIKNPVTSSGMSRIWWKQTYKVSGTGTVQYPSGTGTIYNPGDVFTGLAPSSFGAAAETCTINSGAILQQIIRIKRYFNYVTNNYEYLDIVLDNDYTDCAGMTAEYWAKSNWRDETYRLGIGLHDLAGNIAYVRHIKDVKTPPVYADPGYNDPQGNPIGFNGAILEFDGEYINYPRANIKTLGFEIGNINFKDLADELGISLSELPNYYSGFSILRCPLDSNIVAQGYTIPSVKYDDPNNDISVPINGVRLDDSEDFGILHVVRTGVEYFYSPDFQLHFDGLPSFNNSEFLEIIADFYERSNRIPGTWRGNGGSGGYYGTFQIKMSDTGLTSPRPFITYGQRIIIDKANSLGQLESGAIGVFTNGQRHDNVNRCSGNSNMGQYGGILSSGSARTAILVFSGHAHLTTTRIVAPYNIDLYEQRKAVVNIKNSKTVFYGGSSPSAISNSQYIPTGHFQSFGPTFMSSLIAHNGIADGIEVYGGDATIGYHSIMKEWYYVNQPGYNYQIAVPLESKTNYFLREGRTGNKNENLNNIDGEQWIYNQAYSNRFLTVPYDAMPDRYLPVNEYPYRGLYSYKKTPGEKINSFRRFGTGNFRDVDASNGPINNFKTKAMKLFYWQEDGMGYIPVNERAALSTVLGEAVTIGEGGVMDRYDERTRFYGNQHQFGIAETPQGFVWMDVKRRTLCYSTSGEQVMELAALKGMNSFLQSRFNGNLLSGDHPYLRIGVISGYDYKNKKTYITIRGTDTGDFTMAFDHLEPQFAGFLPILPTMYHPWGEELITNSENLNLSRLVPGAYQIGDIVRGLIDSDTWTCIQSYTHSGSQNPALLPAFWVRTSNANQLWLHNHGDIGKFYGRVHPSSLKFISLTKDAKVEKVFDNFAFHGSKAFFDSLTASTSDQSVTDIDLINNPEYEYRNKVWLSSVPIDDNSGRLVDLKLNVEMMKDNRLNGSPILSKNEKTILNSVTLTYRKAY